MLRLGLAMLLLLFLASASADMEGFIVGGNFTSIRDWQFITFIEIRQNNALVAACGGSLLSSQSVLTAAHCLDDATKKKKLMSQFGFTIFMGHARFERATMFRRAVDYETPAKYDPNDSEVRYDIGVLFLRKAVKFTRNIQKVVLQRTFDYGYKERLAVAGWGATTQDDEHASISQQLKMVKLRGKNYPKCQKMFGVICTKAGAEFAYSGDSGGPLVVWRNRRQVGVVSYRDEAQGMTVFTSIPVYYKWINRTKAKLYKKHCGKGCKKM